MVLPALESKGSLQRLPEVWKGMEKASKGKEVAISLAGLKVAVHAVRELDLTAPSTGEEKG